MTRTVQQIEADAKSRGHLTLGDMREAMLPSSPNVLASAIERRTARYFLRSTREGGPTYYYSAQGTWINGHLPSPYSLAKYRADDGQRMVTSLSPEHPKGRTLSLEKVS